MEEKVGGMSAEESMGALAALTDTIANAHTHKSLAQRVAECLRKFLPLNRVELGWCEGDAADIEIVDCWLEVAEATRATRPLKGSSAEKALEEQRTLYLQGLGSPNPSTAGRVLSLEERVAVGLSAAALVVLPLIDTDGEKGFACFYLSTEKSLNLPEATNFFEALSRLLRMAQHHCRLIEKMASLSRQAFGEKRQLRSELEKLADPQRMVVAVSAAMRRVLEQADLVAGYDSTVLIRGESGTGKELLAQRIHQHSSRRKGPFVIVNCGALPEQLVESELFGHEKGAFTGAQSRHRGRFERANGGTLFLDEVGDLPLPAQVKLLRALQEGTFERVGSEQTLRVDARVMAATHRPLEEMVRRGSFREDLFYRLNVFPIAVPALRERKDDIPPLTHELLSRISRRLGCGPRRLTLQTVSKLQGHSWPGNVRELANALERAVILSRGEEIDSEEIILEGLEFSGQPRLSSAVLSASGDGPVDTLRQMTVKCIEQALLASRGRIYGSAGAAARLGLKPSTLQSKLKKMGISRKDFLR